MNYMKKIYLSIKRNKYNSKKINTKKILICIIILVILFAIWHQITYNENCIIPINITRDSIMRLIPKPEFIVPPPLINFCNQ